MQFLQKKCVQGKLIDLFEIKSNELLTFSNFLGNLRASWLYGDFKLDCVITQRYVLLFLSFQIRTQSEIQKVGKHLFPLPNSQQDKTHGWPLVNTAFILYRTIEFFCGIPCSEAVVRMCSGTGVFLWTFGNCQEH